MFKALSVFAIGLLASKAAAVMGENFRVAEQTDFAKQELLQNIVSGR